MSVDSNRVAELFTAHLDREEAACTNLMRSAERKREAIIANDTQAIKQTTDAEWAAVSEVARLRGIRERLIAGLVRAMDLPEGSGARTLAGALAEEHPELGDRLDRLRGIAVRTEAANLGNQALIRHSLTILDGILDAVAGLPVAMGGYGPKPMPVRRGGGLLDTRA